ncbi:mini-chromosome maintenance complex-binding protein isoform X1 [Bombus huntii]|uniref:mini-chromosome maintenance complex-binding protein isoform X1 n=1 Tax=Bombus huntii TaxID=85661 RepID=UPI0021A97A55|nr:mini-chromosome maintenance complex-binding protein isoform X1 [Bombus huntii]XP_050475455.1 mini-chromosome maintenance complex-binding protein isoform X1 [Bombus huntii]XP_050475456.1 mini-chromosome maintenance complex-binding protein isoform X1 [Bombus huntii]XP_050475457.1 mini-chromosome maintenance complex-binding protein isoform X1 [Bombus huntii]
MELYSVKRPLAKITDWTPEYFIANKSNCNAILENLDALKEIPLLNNAPVHAFRDGQLVRFKGMIQDMHNPEYYLQVYEVKNTQTETYQIKCGMYTDSAKCWPHETILLESEKNQNSERHTCIVISTPGLNDWAKETYEQSHYSSIRSINNHKRSLDKDNSETTNYLELIQKKGRMSPIDNNEKMETMKSNTRQQNAFSKEYILNFPFPMDDGKACIVKIYEDMTLKLNQVIEIIGFISLDPLLNIAHDSDETMTEAEITVHHPPVSLVPRLHAIKIIHSTKQDMTIVPQVISNAELIRSDLHLILSQLLFGDHLAADYLICHLLSSVYMKRDYFCLGTYPLNITHFSVTKCKEFPKYLYKFLTLFIKKSYLLEITLENLNNLTLLPKKDYECNRLTSGVLQLSDNTHLVIDETGLTTGQITQAGRENYNAICDLINFQKVTYDFEFYKIEYETDIPVLILSEAKSFIPCQTQVLLKVDSESESVYPQIIKIAEQYLKDENRLINIRQYLETIRDTKFELNDEDVIKEIQNDFIQWNQKNKNADHLHLLMVLARLLSLSYGSNTLTIEYWKKAFQMEIERLNRLPGKKET